jgi:hypothetical protein
MTVAVLNTSSLLTFLDDLALIPGTGRSFLIAFKLAAFCYRESEMKRPGREAASLTTTFLSAILNLHHACNFLPSTILANKAKQIKSAGYVARMGRRETHQVF